MIKEFEELRAAARCHEILQNLVDDIMMRIDDMGEAIEDAEEAAVQSDLEERNPKAYKELKSNLAELQKLIIAFGKVILQEDESDQGDEE